MFAFTNIKQCRWALAWALVGIASAPHAVAQDEFARRIRELEPRVLSNADAEQAVIDFQDSIRLRLRDANRRNTEEWRTIQSQDDWLAFRRAKLELLRQSLGQFADDDQGLDEHVVGVVPGDGFVIEKVLYKSRLGLWIAANLYKPKPPRAGMPGILICHSHHAPKTQVELQDMGMMWARAGCVVLVPDQLGHGERRDHPFHSDKDYSREFRVSRQDYYFRYDLGIQLHLAGQCLIGQLASDLIRGLDLLTAQPGVDDEKIVLLGAVAGGGDPAAVVAALDERVAALVPYNFGRTSGEFTVKDANSDTSAGTKANDPDSTINFSGGGSWESSRNLRRSAADGFFPWVVVASVAPRRLIYAHEFAWDRDHDPVWRRLQTIYGWFDAAEHLTFAHGSGSVKGQPPESTHCTNIGAVHRRMIHPALKRWFEMPDLTNREFSQRVEAASLLCWTPELRRELAATQNFVHQALRSKLVPQPAAVPPGQSQPLSSAELKTQARTEWTKRLGAIAPATKVKTRGEATEELGTTRVRRFTLDVEPGITLPTILLSPERKDAAAKPPVVVMISQQGKDEFLTQRTEQIQKLLAGGVAVCLPDLRGTGETSPGSARDRTSVATSYSSTELMLGGTLVGARLRDLRSLLMYLRQRADVDAARILLWGDSFSLPNPADTNPLVPHGIDDRPRQSEPLGPLLALLGGLFEDQVRAIYTRGGVASFSSVLNQPCVYIPHDVVVPGMLTTGDVPTLAARLAPLPLRCDKMVDGVNRLLTPEETKQSWQPAVEAHRPGQTLVLEETLSPAEWMLKVVKNGAPSQP